MTKMHEDYIAHISQKDNRIQTVSEHLDAVQEGCEVFGGKIGVGHLAGMAGMLHDMGKNTAAFKRYIQLVTTDPRHAPKRGSVDHSTAGGRWLYRRYHKKALLPEEKAAVEWIANCIISHHQGLRDYLAPEAETPFLERVAHKKDGMEEYDQAVEALLNNWTEEELDCYFADATKELKQVLQIIKSNKLKPIASSLLIKYMFSCLVDADRTNTREFEENRYEGWTKDNRAFFQRSYELLMQKLHQMNQGENADKPINLLRKAMSEQCEEFALKPSGVYTLSIPTGGGKTLASLRYALKHAMEYGKERIIYIVPYTTIIEQNAKQIRNILQDDDNILEHHSNVIEDFDYNPKDPKQKADYQLQKERLSLARDNWDRPIIFTTMVQFLNTFYAKGTRNARRLHRLSNAVLIFDEVQSVPPKCVSLFNAALNFLHSFGRSSLILCTATQPALDFVKNKLMMPDEAEIIRKLEDVTHHFKRVELSNQITDDGWTTEELANFVRERMGELNSVLVILNTKAAVRKLYIKLKEEGWVEEEQVELCHLSTGMCAAHRKEKLKEINVALDPKASKRIICISTQLIEAGVDVSFQCVIRSLAGLDSIAQAAGRCNRHSEAELRQVYVIRSAEESLVKLPEIAVGAEISARLFREHKDDPERFRNGLLSPEAMEMYFQHYFKQIESQLDYQVPQLGNLNLFDLLNFNKVYYEDYCRTNGKTPEIVSRPSFATAEQHFEVIANRSVSVLVPYEEKGRELILDLNGGQEPEKLSQLLREAQQYVVNLYEPDRIRLEREGIIYPLLHGHVWTLRDDAYSIEFGLNPKGEGGSAWAFTDL
jgi:CRISPR-associated endonuclease/helicase Cas3